MSFKLPNQFNNGAKGYKWLNLQDVLDMEPPVYLVQGIIPENAVCLLYGQYGTLKTFLALNLAHCICNGIEFHGRAVQAGAVAYIAGEGAAGIGKRIRALKTYYESPQTKQNTFWLNRDQFNLLDDEHVDRLVADLKNLYQEYNVAFKLLIIDTLSRAIQGAPEDESSFGKVVANAERIKEALGEGASIILVHHAGKDKSRGGRGSSVIGSNVDTVIALDRDKEESPDKLKLTMEKLKDDEDGWDLHFRTTKVNTHRAEKNIHEESLVLELVDMPAQKDAEREADRISIATVLGVGSHSLSQCVEALAKSKGRATSHIRKVIPEEWVPVPLADGTILKMKRYETHDRGRANVIIEQFTT